jgi:predicted dehydrogenase
MPTAASGMGRRDVFTDIDPGRDVTDFYVANLEFPNGVIVDFEHTWCCPRKDDRKFTGVFERFFGPKGGISLGFGPEEGKIYPRGTRPEGAVSIDQPGNDSSGAAIHAFCQAIRNNTPPVSSVINGRMATYTGLLVRKAVEEKRLVKMSEIGKTS